MRLFFTNRYYDLVFEITQIEKVVNPKWKEYNNTKLKLQDEKGMDSKYLDNRWCFHTNPNITTTRGIAVTNLRPARCEICLKGEICDRPGDFGDHTLGVYVCLHPDHTFYYQKNRKPEIGDEGAILMLRFFIGLCKTISLLKHKIQPDKNYQAHEYPSFVEYYIFDTNQIMPRYIIHWKANKK